MSDRSILKSNDKSLFDQASFIFGIESPGGLGAELYFQPFNEISRLSQFAPSNLNITPIHHMREFEDEEIELGEKTKSQKKMETSFDTEMTTTPQVTIGAMVTPRTELRD
jgi:hypothetical protein